MMKQCCYCGIFISHTTSIASVPENHYNALDWLTELSSKNPCAGLLLRPILCSVHKILELCRRTTNCAGPAISAYVFFLLCSVYLVYVLDTKITETDYDYAD